MKEKNVESVEELLITYERYFSKTAQRKQLKFILRECWSKIRICLIKILNKNKIQVDRSIVKLMAIEIFVKGGTSEQFQSKFYTFLEECRASKDEKEFKQLITIFQDILSNK